MWERCSASCNRGVRDLRMMCLAIFFYGLTFYNKIGIRYLLREEKGDIHGELYDWRHDL